MSGVKRSTIITGLDISSSKISAAALEIFDPTVSRILAYESQPSKGVFRGSIIGLDEASNSIARVLTKLKEKTSRDPGNIYVNCSGDTIAGEKSRGMIPLSSRGREVTRSDMDRCVNAAGTIRLPFNREIIHRIILNYSIDDQPSIKNPLGLYASRLSCEMYVITADINHIQNIYKCVDSAGYDIKGIVYSGIADGTSLLEDEWKEEGVLLLNIGASLTEISIFSGGSLSAIGIIPIGASDIKGEPKTSVEFDNIITGVRTKCEESLKKAIELNPRFDWAYAALEVLCIEMGNMELAGKYAKVARDLGLNYHSLITTINYHKLKTILDKRGITYVCVQYPMCNLGPLKKIFQGNDKGIIFVDNEKIFRDAVVKYGYKNYFIDMFGGGFGHCTEKGNRLLAESIANAILKEAFGK